MSDRPKLLKSRQFHSRIFAVLAVLAALVIHPSKRWSEFHLQFLMWLGYSLVIAGAFGRVYCSAFIGGRKNDEVVRDGPFSVVRNPLYVFSFLATVGVGLEFRSYTVALFLAIVYMVYYPFVVKKEEAFLRHKFGEPYEAYMREVPRWLPDFKLFRESEELTARPRFIRKTAMDAAIFFVPFPCLILITILQRINWLPVWLMLP